MILNATTALRSTNCDYGSEKRQIMASCAGGWPGSGSRDHSWQKGRRGENGGGLRGGKRGAERPGGGSSRHCRFMQRG